MLVGQERVPVMSELHKPGEPSADLDEFESDLRNMLKVVEKHMESSDEEEKVCKPGMSVIDQSTL